jgi:hypothetical protein
MHLLCHGFREHQILTRPRFGEHLRTLLGRFSAHLASNGGAAPYGILRMRGGSAVTSDCNQNRVCREGVNSVHTRRFMRLFSALPLSRVDSPRYIRYAAHGPQSLG